MKKKRLMAAGLSAAMVLSMTACGGKEAPAETKKKRRRQKPRRNRPSRTAEKGPIM